MFLALHNMIKQVIYTWLCLEGHFNLRFFSYLSRLLSKLNLINVCELRAIFVSVGRYLLMYYYFISTLNQLEIWDLLFKMPN